MALLPVAIHCAICKKPVQKIEWWTDPSSQFRYIRVHCHGDTDTMKLSIETIVEYGLQLADGIAFVTKRIALKD